MLVLMRALYVTNYNTSDLHEADQGEVDEYCLALRDKVNMIPVLNCIEYENLVLSLHASSDETRIL